MNASAIHGCPSPVWNSQSVPSTVVAVHAKARTTPNRRRHHASPTPTAVTTSR
ncbi:MAG: hypothetical protein R3B49_04215 [Phycisphaerales bacterium]